MRSDIAIVGFYGSGSSAVIDLLREFDNCGVALDRDRKGRLRPYEHVLFYANGGLFETGALLTGVNSSYGSDKIICDFKDCMNRLNNNNFVSFGSYKWILGDKFMQATEKFLQEIGAVEMNNATYEHKVKTRFSPVMAALQLAAKIVYKRPVYRWGKKNINDKKPSFFCMPKEEQYFSAAQKYVKAYLDMCAQKGKDYMIYDQLVCPQHTHIIKKYFDENFKMIMVVRDARDVYSLSRYFWSKPPYGFSPPLPTDINEFASFWSKNVSFDQQYDNVKVIRFEDLVYQYDDTLKQIMDFIGLDGKNHVRKKAFFKPELSIKNTQTFTLDEEKLAQAQQIAELLPDCIYDFPYEVKTSYGEMFDDSKEVNEKTSYNREKKQHD